MLGWDRVVQFGSISSVQQRSAFLGPPRWRPLKNNLGTDDQADQTLSVRLIYRVVLVKQVVFLVVTMSNAAADALARAREIAAKLSGKCNCMESLTRS